MSNTQTKTKLLVTAALSLCALAAGCARGIDDLPGSFAASAGGTATLGTPADTDTDTDTGVGTSGGSSGGAGTTAVPPDMGDATLGVCGDGLVSAGEECDDGNQVDADGCEADCTKPACQNGVVDPFEMCHAAAALLDAGTDPSFIAIADLDGDGIDDVVSAAPNDNQLSVFFMDAQGQPHHSTTYLAGYQPTQLAAGDLDMDGDVDLVVLDAGEHALVRLLNDGAGNLGGTEVLYQGTHPSALALGHVDLDGRLDLVVGDQSVIVLPGEPPWIGESARILAGDGNGGFASAGMQQLTAPMHTAHLGKVTADGLPDLVVTSQAETTVNVYAGSTVGNFDPSATTNLAAAPLAVAVGNFDPDGFPDLVIAEQDRDELRVMLGKGDGTFQIPTFIQVHAQPVAVVVADLNKDGLDDIAAVTDTQMHGLRGLDNGLFITETVVPINAPATQVVASDINGDGLTDLVLAQPSAGLLEVLMHQP